MQPQPGGQFTNTGPSMFGVKLPDNASEVHNASKFMMPRSFRIIAGEFSVANLLRFAAGCGAILLAATISAQEARRPNVVFVLTDDQRWDTISLNERSQVKTPNIDRLGREGVYFRNSFCTTSLCSPSRASILSGLYAHSHGVLNNFTEYPNDLPSFPRELQAAG